jgi:NodT family efflux transporter outer membrane factor (OMF) lipoprotein
MRIVNIRGAAAASALALLPACTTVGPDYAGPPTVAPLAESGAKFLNSAPDTEGPAIATWWRAFGDPVLDSLMEDALLANRTIASARARLTQAEAVLQARRADRLSVGEARASYDRTRPAVAGLGVLPSGIEVRDIDLYDLTYRASWEIDLFGGQRRSIEGAVARLEMAGASLDDVHLAVLADTAQAYLELRNAQEFLALNAEDADIQQRLVGLIVTRRRLGVASDLDVDRVEGRLATTRAARPAIEAEAAAARARLAVLTGREVAALPDTLLQRGQLPSPPRTFAAGSPADLIRRRPDIRAAERRIAAATAGIGVATAEMFPRISILGRVGFQANDLSDLGSDSFTYALGPVLSWSLPDLRRVRGRIAEAGGRRDESIADYEQTVLQALADAESALARHLRARDEVTGRLEARSRAVRAAALAQLRYREGAGSLIEVLDADRERVEAERLLVSAQARVAASFARLSTALGLGWSSRCSVDVPASAEPTKCS